MLIDVHVHTGAHSSCSNIVLEEAVLRSKEIGLDGICITDHESNAILTEAQRLSNKHGFLIIVGAELLTYEGDLLVFGLKELPAQKMHAQELIDLVTKQNGVCISAHPYRDNCRGMGDLIGEISGLSAVETFNGNTGWADNYQAFLLSQQLGLPCMGGSDAHRLEQVGRYATLFAENISNEREFIQAVKEGRMSPVFE